MIRLTNTVSWIIVLLLSAMCLNYCTKSELTNGDEDWSFVVFSDVQQGYGVYSQLALHMGNIQPVPKVAICCGDIMLRPANEAEWVSFWQTSKPIADQMPLLLARGNHEGNDDASEAVLRKQFHFESALFYQAKKIDNGAYILLDTEKKNEEGSIGPDQFLWLQNKLLELNQDQSVDFVFLFMHRPMFPQGTYAGTPLANSGELHQLFTGFPKVRAVFSGHEHMFHENKKDGICYITTGGAGGILFRGLGGDYFHFTKVSFYENEERINIKTIDIFNEVVEDFDL